MVTADVEHGIIQYMCTFVLGSFSGIEFYMAALVSCIANSCKDMRRMWR